MTSPTPRRESTRDDDRLVLVVDDHPAFVRTVEAVIAATDGFSLAGVATNAAEALVSMADHPELDLVLVDVHLPDLSGIEVARRHAARGGSSVVVLMSSDELAALPADALDVGVAGFLPKEKLTTAALRAIWNDAAG